MGEGECARERRLSSILIAGVVQTLASQTRTPPSYNPSCMDINWKNSLLHRGHAPAQEQTSSTAARAAAACHQSFHL